MSEQKKKFSPPLRPPFFTATLSEPHDGSSSTPPSFLIDFVGNRKKKREKRGGKLSLLFPSAVVLFSLSLSLVREDLSLCARAKLLGDRSEIADDEDTAEQYSYSSFARAREKAPNLLLGEEEEEEHTRGENSNVFFFPENDARGRERRKTKR
jgi:hypothetical protein